MNLLELIEDRQAKSREQASRKKLRPEELDLNLLSILYDKVIDFGDFVVVGDDRGKYAIYTDSDPQFTGCLEKSGELYLFSDTSDPINANYLHKPGVFTKEIDGPAAFICRVKDKHIYNSGADVIVISSTDGNILWRDNNYRYVELKRNLRDNDIAAILMPKDEEDIYTEPEDICVIEQSGTVCSLETHLIRRYEHVEIGTDYIRVRKKFSNEFIYLDRYGAKADRSIWSYPTF